MVKHTKTIRQQQPTNCLSVFDHYVELGYKGLRVVAWCKIYTSTSINRDHKENSGSAKVNYRTRLNNAQIEVKVWDI